MKTTKITLSALALTLSFAALTSCGSSSEDSKDDTITLPPIGGYDSANDVAAAALKAYWPLDGNGTESISSTNPSSALAVTYVDGVKGKAAKFELGYLAYPEIASLATTSGSATISVWAKLSNTKVAPDTDSHISPIFSLSRENQVFGNLNLMGDTHGLVTSDTIVVKGIFRIKEADGAEFGGDAVNLTKTEQWMIDDNANGQNHQAFANKIGGTWAHIVYVFDGAAGANRIYVNGVKISNPQWESRNGGDAKMLNHFTPTRPILGALQTVVDGSNTDTWNSALKGQLDEVRFYDKALTLAEIGALYELEKAGR